MADKATKRHDERPAWGILAPVLDPDWDERLEAERAYRDELKNQGVAILDDFRGNSDGSI